MQREFALFASISLAILLTDFVPGRWARADVDPKLIEAGRRATAYVVIESEKALYMGSSFCVDATGIFITNHHVVEPLAREKNAKIYLIVAPGTKAQKIYTPVVVKTDAARDVAVLRVDRPGPLDALELASPAAITSLRETASVVAFGFPLGQTLSLKKDVVPEITITTGRVSALRHDKGQLVAIQFDASVTHGNSGGPLIDEHGQVVGIVTAGVEGKQINFAGPVGFIRTLLGAANVVLTPRVLTNATAATELINWLASDGPTNRFPAPTDAKLKEDQKVLKDLLSKQYADKSPVGRYNLLFDLLSKAAASKSDPDGRYAMLVEARETAIAAGDVSAAAYVALVLSEEYLLRPADLMKDVVTRMSDRVSQQQDAAMVCALGMMLCEGLAKRERYGDLRKLLPVARSAGIASRNPTVTAQMRDRLSRLEAMAAEFDRVQIALAKLGTTPADPDANLIVGRYITMTRGDIQKGVPMLAKGSDPVLKALADADLAKPSSPEAQKALGDLWWDQATKDAKNPIVTDVCKGRAGFWYLQAAPKLTGLTKTVVEKRLSELPELPAAPPEVMAELLARRLEHRFDNASPLLPRQLDGHIEWKANPGGYRLDGVVQVGNSDKNHGGKWVSADALGGEGFALNGGTLRASGGSITFKGTASNPIVLRGVRIECEYTVSIKAEYTIFEGCTFAKVGNWFSNGGYSSKWQMTNCLLSKCRFAGLTRMDYGVKLVGCLFLDCKFPIRNWGYHNQEGPDEGKIVRTEWSRIVDCDFFRCELATSASWITENCNFVSCVAGAKDEFTSQSDVKVELGVAGRDSMLADLDSKTTCTGAGKVLYIGKPILTDAIQRHPLLQWAMK